MPYKIQTSYFRKCNNETAVSVAIKHPDWFSGDKLPLLFPKYHFLKRYFTDHDWIRYTICYYCEVLSHLDPYTIAQQLDGKTMVCWENPNKFCHRHIVAAWLETNINGLSIAEHSCNNPASRDRISVIIDILNGLKQ